MVQVCNVADWMEGVDRSAVLYLPFTMQSFGLHRRLLILRDDDIRYHCLETGYRDIGVRTTVDTAYLPA